MICIAGKMRLRALIFKAIAILLSHRKRHVFTVDGNIFFALSCFLEEFGILHIKIPS